MALAGGAAHAKEDAVSIAQELSANRLSGEPLINAAADSPWKDVFESGAKEKNVAELPEHVKAEADKAMADVNKTDLKMAEAGPPVNERADPYDGKAMEAQRDQQRQNALDKKRRNSIEDRGSDLNKTWKPGILCPPKKECFVWRKIR